MSGNPPKTTIVHFLFVYVFLITSLALESNLEGTSSYFSIISEASKVDRSLEVHSSVDETECMALCNRRRGCLKGIYNQQSGSCFLEIDDCSHSIVNKHHEDVIPGEGNSVFFTKLGHNFNFDERKFEEEPAGTFYYPPPLSCKEIYKTGRLAKNGRYSIFPFGETGAGEEVYCHMSEIPTCGVGGWTLVMKIDGTKDTFRYDSPYWSSVNSYEPSSALQGLDTNEALSSAYWTTSLTKLCLGMKTGKAISWVLVYTGHVHSLHSLIADGQPRHTNLTLEKWLSLMPNSSLEKFCPKQGFNPSIGNQRVRVGVVAGNSSLSSLIGFGSTGNYTCGNYKGNGVFGIKHLSAFGYIFVQ